MKREKFGSRLGFILISAGCAIGLGNVWRFPYITGQYGGAAFVLIYLLFLLILGLPIMVMEFSVGRASKSSVALSFDRLEPLGTKWHWYKWFGMAGNYLLMMFYTTIGGWLLLYLVKMAAGGFKGLDSAGIEKEFGTLMGQPGNYDCLHDYCCSALFCYLSYRTSERRGENHKSYDADASCAYDRSCGALCYTFRRRRRTGILSCS